MGGGKERRTHFWPWIFLVVVNAVLLANIWRIGWWLHNSDGSVRVQDYVAQWAAGHRVLSGNAPMVYDWAAHSAFQAQLIGSADPVLLYIFYPPHFLFTTPVFTFLEYPQASLAFLAVTALAYVASLRLVLSTWSKAAVVGLAGGGAFYCFWWAQNGFLMAALLTAGLALLKDRPVIAGVFFGLLTIKPQLGFLIPVALLFSGNWRAIVSATGTFIILAVAAEVLLGPGIWARFLTSVSETSNFLESGNLWFKQQSVFALTLLLYGPAFSWITQALLAVIVAAIIAWMWHGPGSHWIKSSALISGSLLASPYLYAYDAVPLTAAAAMLLYGDDKDNLFGWERAVIFLCCLLPIASWYIFSAAVPLGAMLMLLIAVRAFGRGRESSGNRRLASQSTALTA